MKSLIKGPDGFQESELLSEKQRYYTEKGHLVYGSAIDCKLTQGNDAYNDTYYVPNLKVKPSDGMMSIAHKAFDLFKMDNPTLIHEINFDHFVTTHTWKVYLHQAMTIENYYPNRAKESYTDDTRLVDFEKKGAIPYLKSLFEARGRLVLSEEDTTIINGATMSVQTKPNTAAFFGHDLGKNTLSLDVYNQLVIYFDLQTSSAVLSCRSLLDRVIVNHNDRTVQIVDLKTLAGKTLDFVSSLQTWRYDIQSAFYTNAIRAWMDVMGYNTYSILPFVFVVETTKPSLQGNPLVYVCDASLYDVGMNGIPERLSREEYSSRSGNYLVGTYNHRYKELLGINQLAARYNWYMENGFNTPIEIAETNGTFTIDWQGIMLN